jgi:mevalonate kinase
MENSTHNIQNFYAHGKLLISGEYLVLRGAKALAIPLKYGQSLQIIASDGKPQLIWKANYPGKKWFEAIYNTSDFDLQETDNPELAQRLQNILKEARQLNPAFLTQQANITAISSLNFPPEWGIGSSSSLMANIGRWAKVDPFELNRRIFGGSGYDIAAALSDKPVIYHIANSQPISTSIDFTPSFSRNLYFVYQNRKQNSKIAVQNFANISVSQTTIDIISVITLKMATTESFDEFMSLMKNHELLLTGVLQQIPVQLYRFPDFDGSIKSMGAWGGDYLLAASVQGSEYVTDYFKNEGFETVFGWDEMVLEKLAFV